MQYMTDFKEVVSGSLPGPRNVQSHVQLSASYNTAIDQIHRTAHDEMVLAQAWAAACQLEAGVDVLFKVCAPMLSIRLNGFITNHSGVFEKLREHVMTSGFALAQNDSGDRDYVCTLYKHGVQVSEYERYVTDHGRDHLMSVLYDEMTRDLFTPAFLGDVFNLILDLPYVKASGEFGTHKDANP